MAGPNGPCLPNCGAEERKTNMAVRKIYQDRSTQVFLTDETPETEEYGRPFMVITRRAMGAPPGAYTLMPKVYGSLDKLPMLNFPTGWLVKAFIADRPRVEGASWGRRTKAAIRMAHDFLKRTLPRNPDEEREG